MRDRVTGQSFLIDTGADISLLPANPKIDVKPSGRKLFAANETRIDTFGESLRELNLGPRRPFRWNFCIAAVPHAIIGADLLKHYGLLVDLGRRRLIDSATKLYTLAVARVVPFQAVSSVVPGSGFAGLLAEFPEITGSSRVAPPGDQDVLHYIMTTGPRVAQRPRRLSLEKLKAAKAEFRALVAAGICRPSSSPWTSPIHLVLKKDGTWRVCGDYRKLNAITTPDRYPTPHLYDCTVNLQGKSIFTSLDLHRAYNQIPMAPEDIQKTAVCTPFGLFEFCVMTYGLRNAGQSFQRYINRALGDLEFAFVYIDDILIASSSPEEHVAHLREVFSRLRKFHLRLNVDKCVFGVPELEFLGHTVDGRGIRPTADKVAAIVQFPRPTNIV